LLGLRLDLKRPNRETGLLCELRSQARVNSNAIIITKQAAGSAKIDPLMASFNAISLMSMHPMPRSTARVTILDWSRDGPRRIGA
jgi:hypothetical protein